MPRKRTRRQLRESDILYEKAGNYIAQTEDGYTVFRHAGTHAVTDSAYPLTDDGFSIAAARVDYLAKPKGNPMSRKSSLTRRKAREMLAEGEYTSERQRRFLGARASGEPRRNPGFPETGYDRATQRLKEAWLQTAEGDRLRRRLNATLFGKGDQARAREAYNDSLNAYIERHTRGAKPNAPRATWGVWVVTDGYDNFAVAVAESEKAALVELRLSLGSKVEGIKFIPIVEGLSKAKAVEAGRRVAQKVIPGAEEATFAPAVIHHRHR